MNTSPKLLISRLMRGLLLVTVAAALLGGLGAGLARLGIPLGSPMNHWILVHGPLMICGFLGTLICLERAVALQSRYRWSMLVPACTAVGALFLLASPNAVIAKVFITLGSIGFSGILILMFRLHPSRDILTMGAGAACWVVGNILWLTGSPVFQVVHLWSAFLILTIVGERLELSRVRRLTPQVIRLFTIVTSIYLVGVALTIINLDVGIRLLGVGAVLLALWLYKYDIAGQTIRQKGLTRYIAACLLLGYFWLGFGGVIAIWKGAVYAGADYAIILHAFLLGFVFSMIFGHAPIIFPALTNLKFQYTPLFYVHLFLLHSSMAYRMYGSLIGDYTMQQQGGFLNVMSVLLFLVVTLTTVARSNLRRV